MSTVHTYAVPAGVATLLQDLGVSVPSVLRRAGLPADHLAQGPATMSAGEFHGLWVALEAESGDPHLPLTMARALRTEQFNPPVFAAMCSPDLRVAADRIARHKRLVGPLRLEVDEGPHGLRIAPVWPPDLAPPTVLVTFELLFWVSLARIGLRSQVRPARVVSPDPPPEQEAYRDYLGVEITRGPRPEVTFSSEDARRRFLTADEEMWAFFEPELARRLAALDRSAGTADRVRSALVEQLPAGRAGMRDVAEHLAVSSRTLQRRLHDEGTTFQAVLAQTRESLARHYLTQSDLPATEIAFLLGYDDTNSFYRAFSGWTGSTPLALRSGLTSA